MRSAEGGGGGVSHDTVASTPGSDLARRVDANISALQVISSSSPSVLMKEHQQCTCTMPGCEYPGNTQSAAGLAPGRVHGCQDSARQIRVSVQRSFSAALPPACLTWLIVVVSKLCSSARCKLTAELHVAL